MEVTKPTKNPTKELDDNIWLEFQKIAKKIILEKGEYFIKEGKRSNQIGFILEGSARIFLNTEDKEVTKEFLFEGDLIGYSPSFLTNTTSSINIQATEKMEMEIINYDDFIMLNKNYESWREFRRINAENLFILKSKREISFLKDTPHKRYENLINERPHVIQRIPLSYIASYLGIRQETLSRIRKKIS